MANELKYLDSSYKTNYYLKVDEALTDALSTTPFYYLSSYYDYIDIYSLLGSYYNSSLGENITPNYLYNGLEDDSSATSKGFYFYQSSNNVNKYKGLIGAKKLSDRDTWVKTLNLPFIFNESTKDFVIAGTFPKFKTRYYFGIEPGDYILRRCYDIKRKRTDVNGNIISPIADRPIDNSYIQITSPSGDVTYLFKSDFIATNGKDREGDDVVPTSIIIGLHGAGGGGSYGYSNSDSVYYGNGGGGGASAYFVLTFTKDYNMFTIHVGKGGEGGTPSSTYGKFGEDSTLSYRTVSGLENSNIALVIVPGGEGGNFGYNPVPAHGGEDCSSYGSQISYLSYIDGGAGGVAEDNSGSGENINETVIASTDRSSIYVLSDNYHLRKSITSYGGNFFDGSRFRGFYMKSAGGGSSALSNGYQYRYNSSGSGADSVYITINGSLVKNPTCYGCGGAGGNYPLALSSCAGANGAFEIYY